MPQKSLLTIILYYRRNGLMSTSAYTVKDIIERIDSKEILLPSMQRKFVWSEEKIINLFDSMMRGYPFGNFIFWNIDSKDDINR